MRLRWWTAGVAGVLLLLVWIGADLSARGQHDLTDFDPHTVARLETAMWRSYYAHERVALFRELAELLRSQYHLPFWTSYAGAFRAARAAAIFQSGHGRADYERALPDLRSFYAIIRRQSSVPFDVDEAAARELEWWIVHRERDSRPAGELERALAALQAGIYSKPEALFREHAQARADAMRVRDSQADWTRIGILLDRSWVSLWQSVQRLPPRRILSETR
jgi:hypothetical protein